jgi:hypothetical protein
MVSAEHDERREAVLARALGVREAVLQRVLGRQERHDPLARRVDAEVDDEMPQVVLLRGAHRAVGQEDERPAPRQAPHRMVRVDPRIHALRAPQLGLAAAEARRRRRGRRSESMHEVGRHPASKS